MKQNVGSLGKSKRSTNLSQITTSKTERACTASAPDKGLELKRELATCLLANLEVISNHSQGYVLCQHKTNSKAYLEPLCLIMSSQGIFLTFLSYYGLQFCFCFCGILMCANGILMCLCICMCFL